MDHLRTLLLTSLLFFTAQVFSGEFSPGYPSAYRYFPELAGALDKDSDGLLSHDELIEGYHAPYLNKDLYQTIRLYLVNFEPWQNPVTALLSRDSIELAELSGQVAKYHYEQDNGFWDTWLARPERQPFNNAYRQLFPHGLTSITPDNLLQKYFPDCVLIASLASIASSETGKRLIFNYFHTTTDERTFDIVFPGIDDGTLIQFREVERYSHFAETRDGGVWLAMLEAAYAESSKSFVKKYGQDDWTRFDYRKYSKLDGVDQVQAIDVLMGSYSDFINPQLQSQEQLKELLNSFVDNEKVAIFSVDPSLSTLLELRPFARIKSYHAYSLISYDQEKDIVYIRDPHGCSAMLTNFYTINQHIQPLSSGNSEIFEVIKSHPRDPDYKLAYGLTEPELNQFLNQTAPQALDIIAKGKIPYISEPISTSERSPARTGIIAMTVEQFIDTFNTLFISQCGPYQCPTDNN
ncbi:hypothetical protein [Endozoicomonas sp. 8E]|uniref:hypothetical protein n=1 Tax=Endozoicomonas sp. 8E TaxID=3035692 RepID=UPI0029392504|nr:hypothetical protein [Endozoicomonas sp. 8E]WOG28995.1 hypothetical protein P6910_04850 [Endozoicomonas sp. 8E]